MNKYLISSVFVLAVVLRWPPAVRAAISYNGGYYTNLCDSGTAANYYSCNSGCNPQTGSCSSDNMGVVSWTCQGKWNQCLESESQWGNYLKIENISCGYTVQMSLFDKKCRRIDESWDSSCRLLGYMTWYSGDCYEGAGVNPAVTKIPVATVAPTVSPTPASKITNPTMKILPTNTPLPTIIPESTVKPTLMVTSVPDPGVCNIKCRLASDCRIGFACMDNYCRNPACPADKTCFCGQAVAKAATESAITTKTPETGVETWLGMAGMGSLGLVGFKLRKLAKRVW